MQAPDITHIVTDNIILSAAADKNITVSVVRTDKIHPVISGNKWYKLRYYLEEAKMQNKQDIITFGGAWSNHIIATAAACKMNGLSSAGIIRGEEPEQLSTTLLQAKEYGMQLIFISRKDYKQKKIPVPFNEANKYYLINEGGYGIKGMNGASAILEIVDKNLYTHIICAVGTGTMMAGLIKSSLPHQQVMGISVLKNKPAPEIGIQGLLGDTGKEIKVIYDYHFGGYARQQRALIEFMNDFYQQTSIPSDFVYTGKLFFAVADLIKNNFFPSGSRLLVIHSGGLQGNASLPKGTLLF